MKGEVGNQTHQLFCMGLLSLFSNSPFCHCPADRWKNTVLVFFVSLGSRLKPQFQPPYMKRKLSLISFTMYVCMQSETSLGAPNCPPPPYFFERSRFDKLHLWGASKMHGGKKKKGILSHCIPPPPFSLWLTGRKRVNFFIEPNRVVKTTFCTLLLQCCCFTLLCAWLLYSLLHIKARQTGGNIVMMSCGGKQSVCVGGKADEKNPRNYF